MQGAPSFSVIGLFLQADPVVKAVMLLLVAASVGVWTIVIDKAMRFGRLRRDARALDAVSRGPSVDASGEGLSADILQAALVARGEGTDETRAERQERLREVMRMVLADRLRPLEPGLSFLATIGSAAPFVGLFGTVWGIMSSFASIASANDTSLAVVAPGIAEALLSTAIGLAAAIPAVVAYNRLATDLGRSRALALAAIGRLSGRLSMTGAEMRPRAAE
jgi:biopolymer transport protein TolQ